MNILVGLSGGVDSATTAYLLKKQGHNVMGATMSIWGEKGLATVHNTGKNACYGPDEKEDIEAAKKIADEIGIPYYVFDCKKEYEEIVMKNFREEYQNGKTPNPCVWCNSLIKFKALPEIAKKEGLEFDKFATGHYARIEEKDGIFYLKKALEPRKDQTYFLHRLKQEQLKNIMFPLGGFSKEETRNIAREAGLTVSDKKDSQDFYAGDYNDLLEFDEKEGNFVDLNGNVLGKHKGFWNYTIGQRKGIGIAAPHPLYVLELRKETNEVVVGEADKTFKNDMLVDNLSWIVKAPDDRENVIVKIRSAHQGTPAQIFFEGDKLRVVFEDPQKSIAPGQSAVFYQDDIVLGGGIIN